MGLRKRTKTLSKTAQSLLRGGENEKVDFKRSAKGIHSEDLVAFANTRRGGHILVGVDEFVGPDGAQHGVVKGCDVSDQTIVEILNKAMVCVPPVAMDVYIENLDHAPILRISFPPSEARPHCTPKGTYCIRDGSRNRGLHPSELLEIFLDTEARSFAQKFEAAANKISDDLASLEANLEFTIEAMADQLEWTEVNLGGTEGKINSILNYVVALDAGMSDASARLRALFRQDNRDDPIREKKKKELLSKLVEELWGKREIWNTAGHEIKSVEVTGKLAEEFTEEEIRSLSEEAMTLVKKRDLDKYFIEVESPKDCSKTELRAFAKLVREGGEVDDEVEGRIREAFKLGFVKYDGKIVGIAALKRRPLPYRKARFLDAATDLDPADYPIELGWIYMQPRHRKKGQTQRLLDALFEREESSGVYTTVRTLNAAMLAILPHYRFVKEGRDYPSKMHPGETIGLYLRKR